MIHQNTKNVGDKNQYEKKHFKELESVMCDVVKMRLKRRDERGRGKVDP